jgi:ABC-type lipoprotein export system ATPase subunit
LKQTLIVVTHDEALARKADRTYRMVDGELLVQR